MPKIRVMIIEDSRTIREFLQQIVSSDPRLEVISCVESAEDALRALTRVSPDVISMDIHLPGMNGFQATQRIMEEKPTPIVVVTGSVRAQELNTSLDALKAGALSVVEKPVGRTHSDYQSLAERLCTQLAIMSQVRVVRQRFNQPRHLLDKRRAKRDLPGQCLAGRSCLRMIGIVASTGGPQALQRFLGDIPADFPLPIVLVQHITASFHQGFVRWLDQGCPLSVVTAAHEQAVRSGQVYVAPPDQHLCVEPSRLILRRSQPVCAQRPSGTVLLESMAASLGHAALGLVLTGMGDDGAAGLLKIRQAGGYTIAEDASTAVVYGMPAAAARLGGVCEALPLAEIGPRIRHLVSIKSEAV